MTNEQLYLAESVTDYINQSEYLSGRDMRTLAQLRENYVCADSPIGEYRCQVEIRFSSQSERRPICVDTCLQHEIYDLIIKHNVNTIGSCCGHGRKQAYIQVSPQSVQKMHELGYEPLPEREDGQGKWCFKPKTYFYEPVSVSYKFDAKDNENTVPPFNDCANTAPPYNEGLRNILAEEGE